MTISRAYVLGAVLAAVLATSGAQAANLVVNGGFEDGTFTDDAAPAHYDALAAGDTDLSNWIVGNTLAWGLNPTDINVNGGVGYVDLTGIGSNAPAYGTLSQSLDTVAGINYFFDIFVTLDVATGGIEVTAGGTPVTLTGTPGSYGGAGGTTWGELTGSFTATAATTLLRIAGISPVGAPTNSLIGVDDVSVTSDVPEATTWTMMIAGFAGLGFALRRRRPLAV